MFSCCSKKIEDITDQVEIEADKILSSDTCTNEQTDPPHKVQHSRVKYRFNKTQAIIFL